MREKEEEKKPPPVREDELVYMERKSLKSESCMALPTEPMVVVTETGGCFNPIFMSDF